MANHETTNSYACSLIERLSDALAIYSSDHYATRTIQLEARAYLKAKKNFLHPLETTTNTAMKDLRTLCNEAIQLWDADCDMDGVINEMRTALAQPEPEGVTPDHVNLIGFAFGREPWATWLRKGGCLESAHCELSDLMLAAIAHYARPAIKPVPVAERPWEREGWWDEYGMCWRFDPCDRGWWSYGPILPSDGDPAPFTYLLPHHALPLPQP